MSIATTSMDGDKPSNVEPIRRPWSDPPVSDFEGPGHVLSTWPGAVIEFSADGELLSANETGRLLMRASAQLPGSPLPGLVALARQANGSVNDRLEVKFDKSMRWFDCTALPCSNGNVVILARDQTYDINIRQALFDSRQRYRDLVTISSDFAFETDSSGTFVFVSPHGALGYSAEDLIGRSPREFLVDNEVEDADLPFHTRTAQTQTQIWLRNVDGEETCLLASAVPVIDHAGIWRGARGLCRDVTHERLRDSELAQVKVREQVVAYVVNQIREEARPQAMLEAAVSMLGRAASAASAVLSFDPGEGWKLSASYGEWPDRVDVEKLAKGFTTSKRDFDFGVGDCRLLGRTTWYHGAINGAVLLLRETSSRAWNDDEHAMLEAVAGQLAIGMRQIADQQELERLSTTDGLTGLMNRRAFQASLENALDRAERQETGGALLFVDLDNFKQINDLKGHEVGDTVLCEIAGLLCAQNRKYDLVARLGGDEFAVWLDDVTLDLACERASQIVSAIEPLARKYSKTSNPLGASVGLAVREQGSREPFRDLLIRADEAMYAAKRAGKNGWAVAKPSVPEAAADQEPVAHRETPAATDNCD